MFFDFSGSAVRFGFSRFWTFRLSSCLHSFLVVRVFDWALSDSTVKRSFSESVIVSSVVVVLVRAFLLWPTVGSSPARSQTHH